VSTISQLRHAALQTQRRIRHRFTSALARFHHTQINHTTQGMTSNTAEPTTLARGNEGQDTIIIDARQSTRNRWRRS